MTEKNETYRVGRQQPQNLYRGEQYIGVMFSADDAALVVAALNEQGGEPVALIDREGDRWNWAGRNYYRLNENRTPSPRSAIQEEFGPVTEVWE